MRSFLGILPLFLLNWPPCDGEVIIKSPRITNWGAWQNMAKCPPNTYATGIQTKYEAYQGNGDDSGLNEVVFYCQPLDRTNAPTNVWITGGSGPKGDWQPIQWCPEDQVIIGFALRSEPDYGDTADDFGAVNFAAFCGYPFGPRTHYNRIQGETIHYGTWSADQFCPMGTVACGIQSQIQPTHSGDNTALNNVNVACCDVIDTGDEYLRPPTDRATIFSPRIINRGRWYPMARCPKYHWAFGMQIQYEKYQGNGDDSALNDVALYYLPFWNPKPEPVFIRGGRGPYGDWQPIHWCPENQVIVGFALRSEKWYCNTADDFGAVNFAALCGSSEEIETLKNATKIHGKALYSITKYMFLGPSIDYGVWTQDQYCPYGYGVCGIQSQIEEPQGIEGDDTALNNVNLECCEMF